MMQKDSLQEVKFCIEGVISLMGYAALYAEILANKCQTNLNQNKVSFWILGDAIKGVGDEDMISILDPY